MSNQSVSASLCTDQPQLENEITQSIEGEERTVERPARDTVGSGLTPTPFRLPRSIPTGPGYERQESSKERGGPEPMLKSLRSLSLSRPQIDVRPCFTFNSIGQKTAIPPGIVAARRAPFRGPHRATGKPRSLEPFPGGTGDTKLSLSITR
ncbi:hypothetical protein K0M31_016577 [Melipona bicolor]|uniref:Uncharacterized protein n=1 Tax=Melipona bicolor TaxID=60889 RepID=A0AA40FEK2_9HYME|nr:hypothetical protein K0M31_016577 [Melipona bicolor]